MNKVRESGVFIGESTPVRFGDLKDAEYNPRVMSSQVLARLGNSIAEFGFIEPVVARKEDGLIIGGHQRKRAFYDLLVSRGLPDEAIREIKIPVVYLVGVSDARAKALNLALNKISGEWDFDKLTDVLSFLQTDSDGLDIEVSGFTTPEISDLLGLSDPLAIDAEVQEKETESEPEALTEPKKYAFKVFDPLEIEVCNQALDMFSDGSQEDLSKAFVRAMRQAVDTKN